jgi:hypothetical protein
MVDLASVIRPGDGIICGQACAEPQTLLEALVAQRAQLSGCRVFLGASYSGIVKPSHSDHLRLASYGGIGHNRALSGRRRARRAHPLFADRTLIRPARSSDVVFLR